jgi:ElaA protein
VIRVAGPGDLPACLEVRHEVFVVGQGVPAELDDDGLDPAALHLVALHDGRAVGTARLRDVDGHAKIERVAVREAHRGLGLGRALMARLHDEAAALGYREAALHAQVQVIPFYEALGYAAHGEPFLDAGILHREMTRALP